MLVLEEDGTVVSGMSSREGETVMFTEKINLKEYPRINEWLTKVETEMKITLAKGAEKSITQRRAIKKVFILYFLYLVPLSRIQPYSQFVGRFRSLWRVDQHLPCSARSCVLSS